MNLPVGSDVLTLVLYLHDCHMSGNGLGKKVFERRQGTARF